MSSDTVVISDEPLTIDQYVSVAQHRAKVALSSSVEEKMNRCRQRVDALDHSYSAAGAAGAAGTVGTVGTAGTAGTVGTVGGKVVYGVNTGFGSLKDVAIPPDQLKQLQYNLIRSHAVGQGVPSPDFIVRGMLLHRLKSISLGYSGVRYCVAEKIVEALNKNFIPEVPILGTVGASGDLAPLSHMVLGLLGEGLARDPDTATYVDAKSVMDKLGMTPLTDLCSKEGLALNNGTNFCCAWTVFAWYNAWEALNRSNMIAATTIEALRGTHVAFDPRIHQVKPHPGQIWVAEQMRNWLQSDQSEIFQTHGRHVVQDAYSLRCIPQVCGVVYDNLQYTKGILETELNSVNDNPLIFPDDKDGILSGGNFHAQSLGSAADLITYSLTILCNISERRLDRLVCGSSKHLPSFLTKEAGLRSGLMILQYSSAGITAELRTMSAPGSVHTIPTCSNTEDVVSMAGYSARKAYTASLRTRNVLTNEFFSAVQALSFTKESPGPKLKRQVERFRRLVPVIEEDVYMRPLILQTEKFLFHS